LPPDVRKGFAFPISASDILGLRPEALGKAQTKREKSFPEGHRPSAHQAAKPRGAI
jgi:hypothetical protein